MLNLPTMPTVPAHSLSDETVVSVSPIASILPVSSQSPDQGFNDILAQTLAKNFSEENNSENTVSAKASVADMAVTECEISSDSAMIAMTLPIPAVDIAPIADHHPADEAAMSFSHSSGNSLYTSAQERTQPLSFSQAYSGNLQASRQYHAISTSAPEVSNGNSNIGNVSGINHDQVAQPAISADSGKVLPQSMTTLPITHANNIPTPATSGPPSTISASIPLPTAFDNPAWPDVFGQKITWMATQRLQSAELKLHPAHLGPIEITLQISGEQGVQQLSAQFASHHLAVREAIEANLPRLRELMAENGITLTDASVSADTSRQHTENGQGKTASHPGADNFAYDSIDQQEAHSLSVRHEGIINTFA